ncbi:DUF1573 domain-containing protein [Flammeovirga kamogawensis]|uniref:DUF1573 domain-containing protein n=1 Tax=Flammeovirga kamogawensis TaxID=373891 RepID=A0ABX8GTG6_9BACT|nr:DUF1573 domain-containing protein [Flammeovirga kamogawensis]MBB6463981.1 hypothetical protein [Flammeovirga kamogawensis]QWG06608.1 DUF1573 domain-containing protein [Flammeovirga kamogawensis]TRX68432.1 DUF1573 domain-containing protein [Flammeovirga kamogawensis]
MINKVYFFICCFLILASTSSAQNFLDFEKDSVFLGKLSSNLDTIRYSFKFDVKSTSSISIDTVITDCACSLPSYSSNKIIKGEGGTIDITYIPYKAGPFTKVFTVRLNDSKQEYKLKLAGFIRPSKISFDKLYPYGEKIKWSHKKVSFGMLTAQGTASKTVYFYNNTDDTLRFEKAPNTPDYLGVLIDSGQYEVMPNAEGSFELFIKPEDREEFGYAQDTFSIVLSNGKEELTSNCIVSASVQYPESEGDGPKPKMGLSSTYMNLGNVKNNGEKIITLSVMNTGKVPLKILKVETNHGLSLLSIEDNEVQPFETVNVNVRYLETPRTGKETRSFTLFTNDPIDPVTIITVKANVIK